MKDRTTHKRALVALLVLLPFSAVRAEPTVVATGLSAPIKIDIAYDGMLVVTESGTGANDGRLALIDTHGIVRPLLAGLPSGVSAAGDPSGPTAVRLRGCCVVDLTIGEGDTLVFADGGGEMPNPLGPSSPVFSAMLRAVFSGPIAQLAGGFELTAADHDRLADGLEVELTSPTGEGARLALLADLKDVRPDPITTVRGSNPFDLSSRGRRTLLVDAAQNGIVQIGAFGPPKTLLRFDPVPNPLPFGPPVSDAVPTSMHGIGGDEYLVTLLVGFPFAPGTASVRVVDVGKRDESELISGLTSATDVLQIGSDVYVLELTGDLLADPPPPGRLLRFADRSDKGVIADGLAGPTGMAYARRQGRIYIVESFAGQVVSIDVE